VKRGFSQTRFAAIGYHQAMVTDVEAPVFFGRGLVFLVVW